MEGAAGVPVSWPDGVSAELTAVERVPNSWASDVPPKHVVVRVTVTVRNGGSEPLSWEPMSRETDLLYGADRYEAESEPGYSYDDPKDHRRLSSDDPERVMPGSQVRVVESSVLPEDQLGVLAVRLKLPAVDGFREPYLFTGVESVLKTVK